MMACPEGMTWTVKATDDGGIDFDCVRVLQGMVSTAPRNPFGPDSAGRGAINRPQKARSSWATTEAVAAAAADSLRCNSGPHPTCSAISFPGSHGRISVQTNSSGYVAWGIYMYNSAADAGPWTVNVFVGRKRVDRQMQGYAPHGSIAPAYATSGQVLRFEAVHTDLAGNVYVNVPNACIIT